MSFENVSIVSCILLTAVNMLFLYVTSTRLEDAEKRLCDLEFKTHNIVNHIVDKR